MHEPRTALHEHPLLLTDLFDPALYSAEAAALPYYFLAVIITAVSVYVWFRDPDTRVTRLHSALSFTLVVWCLGRAVLLQTTDPAAAVIISRLIYGSICLIIALLFEFSCVLTRSQRRHSLTIRLNWLIAVVMAFLSLTTPWMVAGWQDQPWGMEPWSGPLGRVLIGWALLQIGIVLWEIRGGLRAAGPNTRERRRLLAYAGAMVLVMLSTSDLLLALGAPVFPLSAVSITGYVIVTAWMHRRYGLVEVTSHIAAEKMMDLIQHALLIMDAEGTIQAINERTASLVGLSADELTGCPASAIFGDLFLPENIHRLAQDDYADLEKEFILHPRDGREARDVAASFIAIRDRQQNVIAYLALIRDVTTERRRQQARLAEGLRDGLTQLPNRMMFIGMLDAAVKQARGGGHRSFAACMIGLDRLRVINEDLGYAAGDRVLITIAERLRRLLSPEETVARVGGDEFGLLVSLGDFSRLRTRLQAIHKAISAPIQLDDHALYPSASIGVATSDIAFNSGSDALRNASVAMFKAKETGGGAIRWISPEEIGSQRTRLEDALRHAIAEHEFVVYYQPVISVRSGCIAGFEALVRWQHPEKGLLGPQEFIEYAEQSGLVAMIDRQVLEQACADLVEFRRVAGFENAHVSVNMAEDDLRPTDCARNVTTLIARYGLPNGALRLELLERVAMTGQVQATLTQLHTAGLQVCIDDFGTGYSSLSRLHELPISVLKIDRAFVHAMIHGKGGEKVITSILALAENLDLTAIAEGAGSEEEARRLVELGCDLIQGFYFAQPMPAAQVLELLSNPSQVHDRIRALRRPAAAQSRANRA